MSTELAASPPHPAPEADIPSVQTPPAPDVRVHPVTGEPRRPWSIWASVSLAYLAVAVVTGGMLVAFWQSKTVQTFAQATWLNGVVETEPGSLVRIAMVTALFAVSLAVGAGAIIVGYYGWKGYGWARVAGFVALGVGLLTLIGNGWMIASLFPLALAVAALWLPVSRAYCDAWHVRRHPVVVALPDQGPIHYGPLPRYLA